MFARVKESCESAVRERVVWDRRGVKVLCVQVCERIVCVKEVCGTEVCEKVLCKNVLCVKVMFDVTKCHACHAK